MNLPLISFCTCQQLGIIKSLIFGYSHYSDWYYAHFFINKKFVIAINKIIRNKLRNDRIKFSSN